MKRNLEIGVIGLGKFGMQFGATLMELGHRVLGIDTDAARVRAAQKLLSQAYEANAMEKEALEQLHIHNLDTVAVSVGDSMEASILVTLNLQELGVKDIIVKALSTAHGKVLKRIGARRVIQPEMDVATLTAYRLSNPGMLDFLPVGGGVLLQEAVVDAWAGKTLSDLNLRDSYGVLVAAVQRASESEYTFVPDPRLPFGKGDKLLIIGPPQGVRDLIS